MNIKNKIDNIIRCYITESTQNNINPTYGRQCISSYTSTRRTHITEASQTLTYTPTHNTGSRDGWIRRLAGDPQQSSSVLLLFVALPPWLGAGFFFNSVVRLAGRRLVVLVVQFVYALSRLPARSLSFLRRVGRFKRRGTVRLDDFGKSTLGWRPTGRPTTLDLLVLRKISEYMTSMTFHIFRASFFLRTIFFLVKESGSREYNLDLFLLLKW